MFRRRGGTDVRAVLCGQYDFDRDRRHAGAAGLGRRFVYLPAFFEASAALGQIRRDSSTGL